VASAVVGRGGAVAVACFVAAALAEIDLCGVCSCQNKY
jgi:hypothetical protein